MSNQALQQAEQSNSKNTGTIDLKAYQLNTVFTTYLKKNYPPNLIEKVTGPNILDKIDSYLEENSARVNVAYRLINDDMRKDSWKCEAVDQNGKDISRTYQTRGSEEEVKQIVLASFIQEYLSNGRYSAALLLGIAGQETEWSNIQGKGGKGPFQITFVSSVTDLKSPDKLKNYNKYRVECGMSEISSPVTTKDGYGYRTNIYLNSVAAMDTYIQKEMILNGAKSEKHVDESDSLRIYNGNVAKHPKYKSLPIMDVYGIQTNLLYEYINAQINPGFVKNSD